MAKHTGLLSRAAEIGRLREKLGEKQRQEAMALKEWEQLRLQAEQTAKQAEQFQHRLTEAQEQRVEQNSQWSRVRSDWETFLHQRREMETEYELTAARIYKPLENRPKRVRSFWKPKFLKGSRR